MWFADDMGNLIFSVFRGPDLASGKQTLVALFGKIRPGSTHESMTIGGSLRIGVDPKRIQQMHRHAIIAFRRSIPPSPLLDRGPRTVLFFPEDDVLRAERAVHEHLRTEIPHGPVSWPIDIFKAIAGGLGLRPKTEPRQLMIVHAGMLVIVEGEGGQLKLLTDHNPRLHEITTSFPNERDATWTMFRDGREIDTCRADPFTVGR